MASPFGLNKPLKQQVVVPLAYRVANGASAFLIDDKNISNLLLELTVTTMTGTTSPLLDVWLQQSFDGTNFRDIVHFATFTTSSTSPSYFEAPFGSAFTPNSATLYSQVGTASIAPSAIKMGPISNYMQVQWVLNGTSPSATFSANLYYN